MNKFVFVLMPFNETFDDIYKLGIKAACQSEKIYCERVDEQYYEGSMLDRIYNQIRNADYIIADMSTRNANVFYEVGYAHALQKKVILITQDDSDIPFDLKHYHHIIYNKNKINELNEKIKSRLAWYLLSDDYENEYDFELQMFINGNLLYKDRKVNLTIPLNGEFVNQKMVFKYTGVISLALKNNMSKVFSGKNTNVSVIFSDNVPIDFTHNIRIIPDNKILIDTYFLGEKIFPKSYWGKNINIEFFNRELLENNYEGEILINTPFSQESYPFEFVFSVDKLF